MASTWRIEMFGVLKACRLDTGQVFDRFRSRPAASLLAYLAYHPRPHAREVLCELLWPEQEPGAARNHLRVVLSSLRRLLEPEGVPAGSVVLSDRNFVGLQSGVVKTDAAEFEAALQHAELASVQLQSRLLAHVVELYRGALLPGYYEEWIAPQARRLEESYFSALRKLIVRLESEGQRERAIEYARQGLTFDALREDVHSDLIQLYLAGGQPLLALRQYHEWEQSLAAQLHVAPGTALNTLSRVAMSEQLSHIEKQITQAQQVQDATQNSKRLQVDRQATPQEKRTEITRGTLATAAAAPLLPLQTTRFFGRSEEIARLWHLLVERRTRLVTLTGLGGSGKTRLALEIARRLTSEYPGALCFVPLGNLSDVNLVADEIADRLQIRPTSNMTSLAQILQTLSDRSTPLFLVLDNFEQLLPEGTSLLHALLARAPHLQLLVTSRQALGLSGEHLLPVAPLPVPSASLTSDQLLNYASVQLFYDRAQAVRPKFRITKHNAEALATLCIHLEGLPLALELAAAHAGTRSPSQILARLNPRHNHRFDFLDEQSPSHSYGHATLHAALEWSYALLWPELQHFFRQLGVFRGGFTVEAVSAVTENANTLHWLQQLQAASLLVVEELDSGPRFRLLETIREFALELLEKNGEQRETHRRHAHYFLKIAETAYPQLLGDEEQEAWMRRLENDLDNFRAALTWLLKNDAVHGLRLAVAMARFWRIAGRDDELCVFLQQALHRGDKAPAATRLIALREMGEVLLRLGGQKTDNFQSAMSYLQESEWLSRQLGDDKNLAWTLRKLGEGAQYTGGDLKAARVFFEESLSIERRRDDPFALAAALHYNGSLARDSGDLERARSFYEESVQLFRAIGNRYGMARPLTLLAALSYLEKAPAQARAYWEQSLPLLRELHDKGGLLWALRFISDMAMRQGDTIAAQQLLQERLEVNRDLGNKEEVLQTALLLEELAGNIA